MRANHNKVLESRLTEENYQKIIALNNAKLNRFVAEAIELCNPDSVFLCTDAEEDIQYIRQQAVANGEEIVLKNPNHTHNRLIHN